jgi:hypothetical protein
VIIKSSAQILMTGVDEYRWTVDRGCSLIVSEGVADEGALRKFQIKSLCCLNQEPWLRLATGTLFVGPVRAHKEAVDPPARTTDGFT